MLKIGIIGGKNAQVNMKRMEKRFQDLAGAFELIHRDYQAIQKKSFASGGSPIKWEELTEPYRRIKASARPGAPVLVYDGRLRDSFIGETGDTIKRIGKQQAFFGTSVPYAGYHQYGTSRMVARPPIQSTPEIKRRWFVIALKWAANEVRKIYPHQA